MKKIILGLTAMIAMISTTAQAELRDPNNLLPDLIQFIGERNFDEVYAQDSLAISAEAVCVDTENQRDCSVDTFQTKVLVKTAEYVIIQKKSLLSGEIIFEDTITRDEFLTVNAALTGSETQMMSTMLIDVTKTDEAEIDLYVESVTYEGNLARVVYSEVCESNQDCSNFKMDMTLNKNADQLNFVPKMYISSDLFEYISELKK